jgi:hypothetical protein
MRKLERVSVWIGEAENAHDAEVGHDAVARAFAG